MKGIIAEAKKLQEIADRLNNKQIDEIATRIIQLVCRSTEYSGNTYRSVWKKKKQAHIVTRRIKWLEAKCSGDYDKAELGALKYALQLIFKDIESEGNNE